MALSLITGPGDSVGREVREGIDGAQRLCSSYGVPASNPAVPLQQSPYLSPTLFWIQSYQKTL